MNARNIKSQNRRLEMEIRKDHDNIVNNILCYLRADLNSVDSEKCINDVLLYLKEQIDQNKDIDYVQGDYVQFLLPYVNKYKKSKRYKMTSLLFDFLPTGIYVLCFFVLFDIFRKATSQNIRILDYMLNITYVLRPAIYIAGLLIFLLGMLCLKNILKASIVPNRKTKVLITNTIVFIVISAGLSIGAYFLNYFGKFNIYSLTVKTSFLCVLIFLLITIILNIVVNTMKKK